MICDHSDCTGCQACVSVCPVQCISMQEDKYGFLYPVIDAEKCLHCNKCERVCPSNAIKSQKIMDIPDVYLAWALNPDVVESSSSGGVYSACAKYILKNGGYVAGAIFDKDFNVKHIVTNDPQDVPHLAKSKYVQSDVSGIYEKIGDLLKSEKDVLFCGTTCQIYGLKAYLISKSIETSRLVTFDVICHGVPSPKVWKHYIEWQKKSYNSDIKNICMRHKVYSKKAFVTKEAMKIDFVNGDTYLAFALADLYKRAFHKDLISRESCYHCKYKSLSRISDITIGDCWFSDFLTSDSNVPYDVTLCIPHSVKGTELITKSNLFGYRKVNSVDAIKANNGMIYSSVSPSKDYNAFFDSLGKIDFDLLVNQYTGENHDKLKAIRKSISHCIEVVLPHFSRHIIHANREKEYTRRLQKNCIPPEAMEKRYL